MKHVGGYMTVEASMILPFSFLIILLVIRLWFFRYDSVLLEMETASAVIDTLERQDLNAEEKAEYAITKMQSRYKDQYISWVFGDMSVSCTSDSVECTLSGRCGSMSGSAVFVELVDAWSLSVTRSRRAVSEVFVIRSFRKALGTENRISDE